MKNILILIMVLASTLALTSCGEESEKAMTEEEQASEYNLSVEEYKEMKDAAARMNMSIEDHMKHVNMEHGETPMWDDSDMIEE